MDGQMAALFLGLSLWDMGANHCPESCLGPAETEDRWSIAVGAVLFQSDDIGREVYVRRDLGVKFGPFQPSIGASLSDGGDVWVGAGMHYTAQHDSGVYYQGHLMPGIYLRGDGPDLGGQLHFRSGIELGYEAPGGVRYALSFDHRSNGDIRDVNPGLETIQFRISIPTQ